MFDCESMMKFFNENQNVMNDVQNTLFDVVNIITCCCHAIKSKKNLYHDKNIKKYIDNYRNYATTFRLISKNYSTTNLKIAYIMQYLIENSKNL